MLLKSGQGQTVDDILFYSYDVLLLEEVGGITYSSFLSTRYIIFYSAMCIVCYDGFSFVLDVVDEGIRMQSGEIYNLRKYKKKTL